MLEFKIRTETVTVTLQNGIYRLDNDSATGKTYLYTLLRSLYEAHTEKVFPVTYDTPI